MNHQPKASAEMVTCPFDSVHVVHISRIIRHITLCERRYDRNGIMRCPFNIEHTMPTEELVPHMRSCISRNLLETEVISEAGDTAQESKSGTINRPILHNHEPSEEWDEVHSYEYGFLSKWTSQAKGNENNSNASRGEETLRNGHINLGAIDMQKKKAVPSKRSVNVNNFNPSLAPVDAQPARMSDEPVNMDPVFQIGFGRGRRKTRDEASN